ncbi:MAG: hypothetical protein J6W00_02815 [Lentisphaeria bacterium]|nr:hypothetical protein [Lentisphaeria bacterium]
MKQNIENEMDNCPQFLVYDAKNELNVSATLKNIPDHLDKTLSFFREVPEWFEAGTDNLDELHGVLEAINNMPEEERKKYSLEDIQKMRHAMERLIACNEMMADPCLNDDQKEVLRCICYWLSLEAMETIPLTPEEEEELF